MNFTPIHVILHSNTTTTK